MKEIYKKYKTLKFKNLSISINKEIGNRLENIRKLLVLTPETVASVLTISANTIKNAEIGNKNVGSDVIGELITFYGYTTKLFYDFDKPLPSWEDLMKQMEDFHKTIKSNAYKVIYGRPELIDLIRYRLINTTLFDEYVDANTIIDFCKDKYQHDYLPKSTPNSLDLAVEKGLLIRHPTASPKAYKKK